VLDRLGPPVLTSVGPDGWPLPVRERSAEVTADGSRLVPAAGVEVADGPVALTFHTHAEVFDGQENVCLVGRAEVRGDEVHVAVDRALNDWGVPRTPLRQAWSMLRARRQLSGRLEEAAARRGQAVPTYDQLGL
jgi:hypothetical protein